MAHQIPARLDSASEHNAVRPGEVDMLKDAFRQPGGVERLDGLQVIAAHQYDFAGFDFANIGRPDEIKSACFGSQDV